jgi:dTDP-4-amino-4,6-dideoxygalactose transaminase
MLRALVPYAMRLKERWPRLYARLGAIARRRLGRQLGMFPHPLADEVGAVSAVLRTTQWNMAYGKGLVHERLEAEFASYTGVAHAVAVNTGGMALQMTMRALGLGHGDEVLHQVDTCSATALAVMNAGCTPVLADVDSATFMLSTDDVRAQLGQHTRAIIATHMWGNVENLDALLELKRERGLPIIEDACLALGAMHGRRMAGSLGDAGVFSFGCIKPIQCGEGGMIVTGDESLARELRAMRHWGDRSIEFGQRDVTQLAWNGRMSEILAAVVREQLKGYPARLARLRDAVAEFAARLAPIEGLELVLGTADLASASFGQVVLRIDEKRLGRTKAALMTELRNRGVHAWHASFEPIAGLTFFRGDAWRRWLPRADLPRVGQNFHRPFPQARLVYESTGLGLSQMNFATSAAALHTLQQLRDVAAHPPS